MKYYVTSSKTEKCNLHFTKSQGVKASHLKGDTPIADRSQKVSRCN